MNLDNALPYCKWKVKVKPSVCYKIESLHVMHCDKSACQVTSIRKPQIACNETEVIHSVSRVRPLL
jgi:hypothetical protein